MKRTKSESKNFFLNIATSKGFILIEDFINMSTDILVKHNLCGNIFKINPGRICYRNYNCKYCSQRNHKSTKEFEIELLNKKPNLILLSEYKNNKTNVLLKCKSCGHVFERLPDTLFNKKNSGCPKCSKKLSKTIEEMKEIIFQLVGDEYIVKNSENIKCSDYLFLYHKKCENNIKITYHNFIDSGTRCRCCQHYINETKIENYLIKNNIQFSKQQTFNNLIREKELKCDFYLKDFNLVIEYDGEGHFKSIFGKNRKEKRQNRKRQQESDSIKNKYFYENHINILRIPYFYAKKIDFILEFILKNYDNFIYRKRLLFKLLKSKNEP